METSSALLALCVGNSPVPVEFPSQRPVTWTFGVFFDLHLNKRWVNSREASDLRCHRAHYDVSVMHVFNHICTSVAWLGDGGLVKPDGVADGHHRFQKRFVRPSLPNHDSIVTGKDQRF